VLITKPEDKAGEISWSKKKLEQDAIARSWSKKHEQETGFKEPEQET